MKVDYCNVVAVVINGFNPISLQIDKNNEVSEYLNDNNQAVSLDVKEIKKEDQGISEVEDNKIKLHQRKNPKIIKNSLVLIITFIAIIIILDTFKYQLNIYFPGLNSILNNLL